MSRADQTLRHNHMKMEVLITAVALCLTVGICVMSVSSAPAPSKVSDDVTAMAIPRSKFKAAVYAHAVYTPVDPFVVSRAKALKNMGVNLAVYKQQAEKAHKQSASIIVFPEDGIYGLTFSRDTLYPYLEQIPDPKAEQWIPCTDPHRHKDSDVQVTLSCMARQNQMYLVANMGDKQPCDPKHDPNCPKDKRYQFNTDVAYGPDGEFLAKYHKYNLFFERQFDKPATPEHVYFETPFGRVGLATCFDVLFREPIIPLVELFNVSVVAFPTGWMDALPLLPAIGFHSSFGRAHGVNFLAANDHLPAFKFDGSGLYGPDGAHAFYYGTGISGLKPKLLFADMDVLRLPQDSNLHINSYQHSAEDFSVRSSFEQEKHLKSREALRQIADYKITDNNTSFQSVLFFDVYTFKTLTQPSGEVQVCQGAICCYLDYQFAAKGGRTDKELYAFGAFDGLHTHNGNYYMQNCVLVKCADPQNKSSCGSETFKSSTRFTRISLRGKFQTKYVYPQLIVSDTHGQLALTEPEAWTYTKAHLETSKYFNASVLNAILLGRDYSRD